MICKNCNAEINDNSKFCTECGNEVSSSNLFSLFSPAGCVSRKTYWAIISVSIGVPVLLAFIMVLAVATLSDVLKFDYSTTGKELLIFTLAIPSILLWWVTIVTSLKRLRDANFSTWLYLLNLIPYLGTLIIFILNGFFPSVEEGNKYCKSKNNLSSKAIKWIYTIILAPILLILVMIGVARLTNDSSVPDIINSVEKKVTQKTKYTSRKNVVVLDGLMWQNEPYTYTEKKVFEYNNYKGGNYGKVQDWNGAINYCRDLTLAGYDDWRLPNKEELVSITDKSGTPAIQKGFKNTSAAYYWSSTVSGEDFAWFVFFGSGIVMDAHKGVHNFYVRCVRDGQ